MTMASEAAHTRGSSLAVTRAEAVPTDRLIRRVAVALYTAVVLLNVTSRGLPADRVEVVLWVAATLGIAGWVADRGSPIAVARDWVPFAGLMLAYSYTRGFADSLGMPVMVDSVATADRILGLGEIPTIRLQNLLPADGEAHWWGLPFTLVYVSHFVATFATAGVLWFRNRDRWLQFQRRFLTVSAIGVVGSILFPAAPPWLAAEQGAIAQVGRSTFDHWALIGLRWAEPMVTTGRDMINHVAAMPSIHAAYAALLMAFFWHQASRRARVLLALYPLAMGFALVMFGEHYVVDILAGWLAVGVTMRGWQALESRREAASRATHT